MCLLLYVASCIYNSHFYVFSMQIQSLIRYRFHKYFLLVYDIAFIFIMFFEEQKLSIVRLLIKSNLLIKKSMGHDFGVICRKCLTQGHRFSSRNLIVLGFIFRSMIHFVLTF